MSRFGLVHRRAELATLARRSREVVMVAAVVGVVTGAVVAAVDELVVRLVDEVTLPASLGWQMVLPGLGLLVAGLILRWWGGGLGPATSDEFLRAFHDRAYVLRVRPLLARLAASVVTLGSGGALGLEGPALYTGATVGSSVQRRWSRRFPTSDARVLMVAGAAAGVAAVFKAPATGAVFALEVPYRDDLARRMLLPALVASVSGYLAFVAVHGTEPLFRAYGAGDVGARELIGAMLLGAGAAVGAGLFAAALRWAKRMSFRSIVPRVAGAAVALGVLALVSSFLTDEPLSLGPGYHVIDWVADPSHSVWLLAAVLALRCAATVATVAGGGVGGLFIPLVVAGALLGEGVGRIVAPDEISLFPVLGVAAFLGAGYRVPLAAVMFVSETTGRPGFVVPGVIASVVADLVMGERSVTPYQREPGAP